jgi:hypothetical protein
MDRKRYVAVYPLTNNHTVLIHDIEYGSFNRVLAGINNDEPEWCEITDEMTFYLGATDEEEGICIPLSECIRY